MGSGSKQVTASFLTKLAQLKNPGGAAGDILFWNGTSWVRLAIGTSAQILGVNAGATAPEWEAAPSGGWEQLANVNAGDNSTSFSSGVIAAKKYLMICLIVKGNTATVTATDVALQFNNDTGTNYAARRQVNGGADATEVSVANMPLWDAFDEQGTAIITIFISNLTGSRKMASWNISYDEEADATVAPTAVIGAGKWNNTAAQITEIDVIATGGTFTFDATTQLLVMGRD